MNVWMGMAHCPAEGCDFLIQLQAEDESDLDQSAVAAFESHAARKHPDLDLRLQGYRQREEEPIGRSRVH